MYNQIGGLKRKNLQLPHLISLPKCGGNNNPFQHAVSSGHLVFPSRSCSDTPSLVPTRMLACSEKRRASESEEEGERFVRKARAVMERHQRVQPLDRSHVFVYTGPPAASPAAFRLCKQRCDRRVVSPVLQHTRHDWCHARLDISDDGVRLHLFCRGGNQPCASSRGPQIEITAAGEPVRTEGVIIKSTPVRTSLSW